jgi:exodeoxyribonuclease-3
MRIATWNVNSLKARLEKVAWWIERARPDVLLLQETKCTDEGAPRAAFEKMGYELCHHGSGGRNGVAIASRTPVTDVETNFGEPLLRPAPLSGELAEPLLRPAPLSGELAEPMDAAETGDASDARPLGEARMVAGNVQGIRVVSLYAPNGRKVGTPFYEAKLAWFGQLLRWLERRRKDEALLLGGDFNVAPADADVWNAEACHGGTHVSPSERAAFEKLLAWGVVDTYRLQHSEPERYTWWDYRAGDFHRNVGMRIDHLLATPAVAARVVASEIDREARKGKPIPSDHAPLALDLDEPGRPFDAGWIAAAARIAARRRSPPK